MKLPNGIEGITTVTHEFVRTNQSAKIRYSNNTYTTFELSLLLNLLYCQSAPNSHRYITTTSSFLTNDPLGEDVFLFETMEQVYLSNVEF
jgi:hypothetical protein